MRKYIFLYKENSEDRDCCAYIEAEAMRFECGHYFGSVILHGACYSKHDFAPYEDIKTVLTEGEYQALIDFNNAIKELGYGIKMGDARYNRGVEICKEIKPIFDKLQSEENKALFEEIIEEEKEYLYDEYSLDEDDIEYIFDNYGLDYRDRAVVGCVYKDSENLGYEEAFSLGYMNNKDTIQNRYFDYAQFGEDLVRENENYLELADGRCVSLCY